MNFLFLSNNYYAKNFKLPRYNEWCFMPESEWQFDYKIRVETTPTCVGQGKTKFWCKDGTLHRSGGPARISKCTTAWYIGSKCIVRLYHTDLTEENITFINSIVTGDIHLSYTEIDLIKKKVNSYLYQNGYKKAPIG